MGEDSAETKISHLAIKKPSGNLKIKNVKHFVPNFLMTLVFLA